MYLVTLQRPAGVGTMPAQVKRILVNASTVNEAAEIFLDSALFGDNWTPVEYERILTNSSIHVLD